MKRLLAILSNWILSLPLAIAQINDCNGVITNRPCPGGTPLMEEKPHQPPSPEELEQRGRDSLINDLENARFRVRRQYGLDVDVSLTQSICRSSPLDDCRSAILDKEREINALVTAELSQGQSSPGPDSSGPTSNDNIAISIVQDDSFWDSWDDYPRYRLPQRPEHGPRHPQHRPRNPHWGRLESPPAAPVRPSSKGAAFGGPGPSSSTGSLSR